MKKYCEKDIVFNHKISKMLEWNVEIITLQGSELEQKVQFKDLNLDSSWLLIPYNDGPGLLFGASYQTTKSIGCCYHEAPNDIKLKLLADIKWRESKVSQRISEDSKRILKALSETDQVNSAYTCKDETLGGISDDDILIIEYLISKDSKEVLSRSPKKKK